jgi:hypothetical protein
MIHLSNTHTSPLVPVATLVASVETSVVAALLVSALDKPSSDTPSSPSLSSTSTSSSSHIALMHACIVSILRITHTAIANNKRKKKKHFQK